MNDSLIDVTTDDGVTLAAYIAGEGPLVICLHGFPDTPRTWSALTPLLVASGYRVLRPYLRGYAPSERPSNGDCSGVRLGRDVLAWADALDAQTFMVIGHDWGALAGYAVANLAPKRVTKLVTLAIPHSQSIVLGLSFLRRSNHFFTLPLPGTARRVRKKRFKPIADIYRKWSPTWADIDEDINASIDYLSAEGVLEGALGMYASFVAAPWRASAQETRAILFRSTTVATLALAGADDGALDPSAFARTPTAFDGPYRYEIFDGVGHFLHREDPKRVLPVILSFICSD